MKIKTTEYNVTANLISPLSFAFVSDLHDAKNQPILDTISGISPNAVLVGGDFIHSEVCFKRGIEFIGAVSSKFTTFVSLGNHESTVCNIRELINKTDATLLDNSFTEYCGMLIGGLTSGVWNENNTPDTDWLDDFSEKDSYKLLLCHHPDYYAKYIRNKNIDLTLSGHAHGGQWRIFGQGIYAPGQGLFPKFTSGFYENRLIVGRGIGNKAPLPRINNSPEIIVLNIC